VKYLVWKSIKRRTQNEGDVYSYWLHMRIVQSSSGSQRLSVLNNLKLGGSRRLMLYILLALKAVGQTFS